MKLVQVRRQALALPEATEEPHFHYSSFRVRGKIFATVSPKGDHLHVFVGEEERQLALALEPGFLEKLFWGRSIVGLRVLLAKAKPMTVEQLLRQSWTRKAPKSLAAKHRESMIKSLAGVSE